MAIFVLGATSVAAEIVPTLSTKTLTDSASVIVVGTEITVDETIKGEQIPRRLLLNSSMPAADGWGNVAWGWAAARHLPCDLPVQK